MTSPTPEASGHPHRVPRWLSILAVVVVAGVLIVLLSVLLRRVGPEPEVWLRIAPPATTVDEATTIALSSGGWRGGEQLLICLNKTGERSCDATSAVLVESADASGNLETSLLAGAELAEGRTTFLVRGLESGQEASRTFRVLRIPDDALSAAGAATPMAPGTLVDLTPIAGGQPSDLTPPAAGNDLQAGNVATLDPAVDLFPDWRGEYFTNPDMAGEPALVRNDPDPNLDWGEDSPAPGVIPPDGFSVRWSRSLSFEPGVYRFVLAAENGGRLVVEGQPVIEAWRGADGQTITVDRTLSGGQYQIVVHFRNLSGPARIAIGWSPLPTSAPIQVAGVSPTPTPDLLSPPTPSDGQPTATATMETSAPGATETTLPTSSVTASASETSTPPNGTATPDTPTMTPTPVTSETPLTPPGSVQRLIEVNPRFGLPGQEIKVNSGNWSPGTVLRVSLGELNTSYTQATPLPGVTFTTPIDSSQAWSFRFIYPDELPWSTPGLSVYVWVHNATWSEWGRDKFTIAIDRP